MKRYCLPLIAAGCMWIAVSTTGCSAKRQPLVLIEPTYSHLRDATPSVTALPRMAASGEQTANRTQQ
jgi:hypothetical protein